MRLHLRLLVAWLAFVLAPAIAGAEGLRVAPVSLDIVAPAAAAALSVQNLGRRPTTVQARVFRWVQRNGVERLEATGDVVVSPPITRVPPGGQLTIRVIRTSKAAARAEEAYRILVDEVPDRAQAQVGTVAFVARLRIPVFFLPAATEPPRVNWRLVRNGGVLLLEGRNTGGSRLRLAEVTLGGGGQVLYRNPGLMGYVLAGGTMRWPVAPAGRGAVAPQIEATTNIGRYRAAAAGP